MRHVAGKTKVATARLERSPGEWLKSVRINIAARDRIPASE